jgi:hypothetical protein
MHAADKDAAAVACEALMAQRLNVATQRCCCCHSQTPVQTSTRESNTAKFTSAGTVLLINLRYDN